jgi:hypothetical protein
VKKKKKNKLLFNQSGRENKKKHSGKTHKKMEKEKSRCGDLIVKASITNKPRFKAGSDLSGRVNLRQVDVEISNESDEDTETFGIAFHFRACTSNDEVK